MPQETNNPVSSGAGWLGKAVESRKAIGATEQAGVPMAGGGNAKTVETAPVKAEEQIPASATIEAVPVQEATPVAVEQKTSEQKTVEQSTRQAVKIQGDETLIEIPGEKPKTVAQLKWELDNGRKLARREQEVHDLERRILQSAATPRTVEQVAPVQQQAARPVPPKGFVPGDPEYDTYLVDLVEFSTQAAVQAGIKPLMDEVGQVKQQQSLGEENVAANREAYAHALSELPWDFEGLPAETQSAISARIGEVAQMYGVNLGDSAQMRQQRISPDAMAKFVIRAFPFGATLPGYEQPAPVVSEELRQLVNSPGPLVDKPKPDPLPVTGINAVAAVQKTEERPAGPVPWGKRVRTWERQPTH